MTPPPTDTPPPAAPRLEQSDALPGGTRFGELEVLHVVGVGGFGIVYRARDHALERDVALKEYLPGALAGRGPGLSVSLRSGADAETYQLGLRSFINEGRLLARFNHPSLLKVYRFWEQNGTAYMVMPFLQGRTLRDVRREMAEPPSEAWIRALLAPLLEGLAQLHREDVYHRDIAPDNILLPPDDPPVLLDFGAARRAISDKTQTFTAILKPNYAPIEQYAEVVQLRQGPWTDLYALGAVVHYLLTGSPPPPATARAIQEDLHLLPHEQFPAYSPAFLDLVDWALAIRPTDRPQSVAVFRDALEGRLAVPLRQRQGVTLPPRDAGGAAEPTQVVTRTVPSTTAAAMRGTPTPAHSLEDDTTQPPTRPGAGPRTGPPARLAPGGPGVAAAPIPVAPAAEVAPRRKGLRAVAALAGLVVVAGAAGWWIGRPAPAADGIAAAGPAGAASSAGIAPPSVTPVVLTSSSASAVPATASTTGIPSTAAAPGNAPPGVTPAAPKPDGSATSALPGATPPAPGNSGAATAGTSTPANAPGSALGAAPSIATAASPAASRARLAAAPAPKAAGATPPRREGRGEPIEAARASTAPRDLAGRSAAEVPPARETTAALPTAEDAARRARAAEPVPQGPQSPREACGKRVFLAMALCMEEQCETARFRDHPQCVKVREIVEQRRRQSNPYSN